MVLDCRPVAKFDATAAACALLGWEGQTPQRQLEGDLEHHAVLRATRTSVVVPPVLEPLGGPGHAQRGRRVQPPTSVAGKTSGGAAGVPGLPGRIPAAARRGADTANDVGPSRPLGPAVREGHLNVTAETPVILAVAGRPSPQPDDHPRFGESDEQQNAEETEHQRRHTST